MPELTIQDHGTFEVESGTRLVRAIEDLGVNILHRCGGHAKCTTCRVEFISGEPDRMTKAEKGKWKDKDISTLRLSCQIRVEHDMTINVVNTVESTGLEDPGKTPADQITPEPEWVDID
ncbi:MAG: 2Fe-2S iron-sulfur cluster-binding protein [Anaerolineales bacterium]